jgi:DNA-binding transcriptional MerR regulator/methylmalonyl-CoA mutase cobalamin-binding subunit
MTGLSIDTVRAWERRYRLVTPARDAGGVRRYSEQDVARLELARAATTLGHPIRAVAKLSDEELHRLVRDAQSHAPVAGAAEPTVHAVIDAVRRYDLDQAERVLHAGALLMPTDEFVMDVLVPLMQRVGTLWESGHLSIAHEHIVSHLVRNLVGRLSRLRESGIPCSMVFATPPGEPHEFGITLAACMASMHGLRPCVLGPNLPAGEIVAAARHLRPRTVVIGITLPMPSGDVARFIHALDARLPSRTEIWVGGEGSTAAAGWPNRARHVPTLRDFLHRIGNAA